MNFQLPKICSFFKFEFLSTNGVPEKMFKENLLLKTLSILYGDSPIFSHELDGIILEIIMGFEHITWVRWVILVIIMDFEQITRDN